MAKDVWKGYPEGRTRAQALVDHTAELLRRDVQQMLLQPGLLVPYEIIEEYRGMLHALEAFAEAISESNSGCWRKDLPKQVQDDLNLADHAINMLGRFYEPAQAVSRA